MSLVKTVESYEERIQETYNYKLEKIRYSKNQKIITEMEQYYIQYFLRWTPLSRHIFYKNKVGGELSLFSLSHLTN